MDKVEKIYSQKGVLRVGFFGLGKSNLGAIEYLKKHYSNLEITFRSEKECQSLPFKAVKTFIGKEAFSEICEDILFLSPSVRRERSELAKAAAKGVIFSSDAELFFARNEKPVYAVTGSDGKSTTTYLSARLLEGAYTSAIPCGNYGVALSPHLDDASGVAYVSELSSFQLSYLEPKSERCVITNITPNHLNWHSSFEEYTEAKKRILYNAKQAVLNFDCATTRALAKEGEVFAFFSTQYSEEQMMRSAKADIYLSLKNGFITANGEPILPISRIRVGGEHNIKNFMAAIALSFGKCNKEKILSLADDFRGLNHRCEIIGEFEGVRYINSSIDSSPKRTLATLNMIQEKVILILGGRSKGLDYGELLPTLKTKTKAIILTGENGSVIFEVLMRDSDFHSGKIPILMTENLKSATIAAAKLAKSGDTVLLSPASVSYDEFSGFEQRGIAFKEYIKDFYGFV